MLPLPGEPRTPAQDRLGSSATEILLLGITHQAASNVPLATPLNAGRRGKCVLIVDKIKHIHFQKESKNLFLPTISILPLCSQSAPTVNTPLPHTGRDLAGHPRCVSMGNGYGKTRLYSSIRSKTTAFPRCTRHHSVQRGRPSPLHKGDESVVKRSQ